MKKLIIILRSILGQIVVFSGITITTIIAYFYSFFCNQAQMIYLLYNLIRITRNITYFFVGIKIEYKGLDNIPTTPCVFVSKHQSSIETSFFFNKQKHKNMYAYKKEISDVWLWGRISLKFGGLRIDRSLGALMMDDYIKQAKKYINDGFSLTIFPEGTRTKIRTNGKFKRGVAKLYSNLDVPFVPVALNTGIVLPRKSFIIYPGKIIIEFLPPMEKGLTEDAFLNKIETIVNQKSLELLNIKV
jgi:1-acyl-sn-glycerol-3-phosphate acyltransferase